MNSPARISARSLTSARRRGAPPGQEDAGSQKARLGGEGEPQKQHDEEIADAADDAKQNLEGLADDRAAA